MPLTEHRVFDQSGLENKHLWRYTGISKFLSLVQTETLFFPSLENMAKEDDKYEGSLPKSYMDYLTWKSHSDIPDYSKELYSQHLAHHKDEDIAFKEFIQGRENWLKACYANRRATYISCWHAAERESDAMWKLYSQSGEGVAVVTTLERINRSLDTTHHSVRGGHVNYVDFESHNVNVSRPNMYEPSLLKRDSFSHEKEFRLVHINKEINLLACIPRTVDEAFKLPYSAGVSITVDLNALIEYVVVSPASPPWFFNVVKECCSSESIEVVQSEMASMPLIFEPNA